MKKLLLILLCLPMIGFGQCIPPDGCKNGKGIYNWPTGENYNGEWKDGKFNGKGTYTSSNKNKYVGYFLNGEKHGKGTYTWTNANGSNFVGQWNNGLKWDGILTEYQKDIKSKGLIIKYFYINGNVTDTLRNDQNYYNPIDIKGAHTYSIIKLNELKPDHYYISLDFNGLKKNFVFDTGATGFVMSNDLLVELKKNGVKAMLINTDESTAITASGNKINFKKYVIDNIRIGDFLLSNVVVSVGSKGTSSLCGIGLFNKFSNVEWNKKDATLKLYK